MELQEIKGACVKNALHTLEVAKEKLDRALLSAQELEHHHTYSTRNDIRGVIGYLQDALEQYAQVNIMNLLQEEEK